MNLKFLSKFRSFLPILQKYRYILIGAVVVALFAFTTYQINYLSSPERDEEVYSELSSTVKKVRFDDDVIAEILKLNDAGVDVNPQLPSGRTNPF